MLNCCLKAMRSQAQKYVVVVGINSRRIWYSMSNCCFQNFSELVEVFGLILLLRDEAVLCEVFSRFDAIAKVDRESSIVTIRRTKCSYMSSFVDRKQIAEEASDCKNLSLFLHVLDTRVFRVFRVAQWLVKEDYLKHF